MLFEGRDVQGMGAAQTLEFRKNVQAVFQDPYACFNPFYRVNHALKFPYRQFGLATSAAQTQKAMEDAYISKHKFHLRAPRNMPVRTMPTKPITVTAVLPTRKSIELSGSLNSHNENP